MDFEAIRLLVEAVWRIAYAQGLVDGARRRAEDREAFQQGKACCLRCKGAGCTYCQGGVL